MPTKEFDTKFQNTTKEMVQLAYEFVNFDKNEIDEIFIFCSLEDGLIIFNLFYKINKKISRVHQLNSYTRKIKFDLSERRIISLLQQGTKLLVEVQKLFKEDKRDVPSNLKIQFNCKSNSFKVDISYDLHFSHLNDGTSSADIFDAWINEEMR